MPNKLVRRYIKRVDATFKREKTSPNAKGLPCVCTCVVDLDQPTDKTDASLGGTTFPEEMAGSKRKEPSWSRSFGITGIELTRPRTSNGPEAAYFAYQPLARPRNVSGT